jgi:hypothetical protein
MDAKVTRFDLHDDNAGTRDCAQLAEVEGAHEERNNNSR